MCGYLLTEPPSRLLGVQVHWAGQKQRTVPRQQSATWASTAHRILHRVRPLREPNTRFAASRENRTDTIPRKGVIKLVKIVKNSYPRVRHPADAFPVVLPADLIRGAGLPFHLHLEVIGSAGDFPPPREDSRSSLLLLNTREPHSSPQLRASFKSLIFFVLLAAGRDFQDYQTLK